MPPMSFDAHQQPENYVNFREAYQSGYTPWDTGITPPELVAAIEGPQAVSAGRALDIGCGTGTNSLYLAQHGWQVTGVDFVPAAIERAQAKLGQAHELKEKVHFWVGDVTQLESLALEPGYTLLFDLGCLHSIPQQARPDYVRGITRLAAPQALYLLYGFTPRPQSDGGPRGITHEEVETLFTQSFIIENLVDSSGPFGSTATWYWLRRAAL